MNQFEPGCVVGVYVEGDCCLETDSGLPADLPLLDARPQTGLYLLLDSQGLHLCLATGSRQVVSIQADFIGGKTGFRLHQAVGRHQPLAKAVGAHKKLPLQVVDLTGGLGRDAMVLALVGCRVTLFERHPVVAALLQDGLRRAAGDAKLAKVVSENIEFHGAEDGLSWLQNRITHLDRPVVYYDPMFPKREKSSLVKKEMQLFHQLVGDDDDVEVVFAQLLQLDVSRIVVKRPRLAPLLTAVAPSHQIVTKSTRWDIYLPSVGRDAGQPAS